MKLSRSQNLHRFVAIVARTVVAGAAMSPEWFLMGRHGECAPLSSLARKGPRFRGLATPYQLIDKMRAARHQVEVKEHTTPNGPMMEVQVAAKGLALMVVPADLCKPLSR